MQLPLVPATARAALSFLSFDSVAVVTAQRAIVAKAASLYSFRRIHAEVARAHPIEKLPDLRHHLLANRLPVFVRENRVPRAQLQVVQLARAVETFVAP